jgi:hypothetical protein
MLPLDLATPILVWYPEYSSEYEYINEKLSADYDFNATLELVDAELFDEDWERSMLEPNEGWEDLGSEVN